LITLRFWFNVNPDQEKQTMTMQEIYQLCIKKGIGADPRGKVGIAKFLARTKKRYDALPKREQQNFDKESFTNPYADTRILFGDSSTSVDKVLVGIDIDVGELLLADRLNEKGEGIDVVIAHHPSGRALAALDEVMELQIDLLSSYGVSVTAAEHLLEKRMGEVFRRFSPLNHNRALDAARLLNIPFMCVHTPADNLGWRFLSERIEQGEFDTVDEVIEFLETVEELRNAQGTKAGPVIFSGKPSSRAGKVRVVEFTGGTEGAKEIYERLSHAGIGTIIGMHVSEEHKKEAEKYHINLVVTGHMASDSIGMNLLLDELEKRGVENIPCSGLIRYKRGTRQSR